MTLGGGPLHSEPAEPAGRATARSWDQDRAVRKLDVDATALPRPVDSAQRLSGGRTGGGASGRRSPGALRGASALPDTSKETEYVAPGSMMGFMTK